MDPNNRPALSHVARVPSRSVSFAPSPTTTLYSPSSSDTEFDFDEINEKAIPLTGTSTDRPHHSPTASTRHQTYRFPPNSTNQSSDRQPRPARSHHASSSYPHSSFSRQSPYTRPRALRMANLFRPWLPIVMYGMTSLAFIIAIAFYRPEVFSLLDDLSVWLRADELFGYAVLFSLIFITTIPPLPLYSTLITLSGYTFGAWTGAFISYCAAFSGALTVFIISRSCFREAISRWLSATMTIKRVVRAVEKRPKLLFLIRLAPYPYNVMNCLLAAAPTLTLRTYATCTGLSLFKVIVHTSMGASIHSFKDFHTTLDQEKNHEHTLAEMSTALGILLCIGTLIYLSVVARNAVNDELDDEPITPCDDEEIIGFLAQPNDLEASMQEQPMMTQSPFRSAGVVPYRLSIDHTESHWVSQSRI